MEKRIMHDQNMLDVKNIYKNFGSLKVLKGVSTTVDKGEVISIIGASGSGKSTLLRCMNLLEEPTFGEVWIEGKLMTPVDPYLHYDVIRASKTYKGLVSGGMEDMEAVMKIKAEDLLIEKHSAEGSECKSLMDKIYRDNHIDTNLGRRKMSMVFQQFNLFNNLNVLDNDQFFRIVDLSLENKVADIMVLLNTIINNGFDGGQLVNGLAHHLRNVMMAKDAATLPLLEVSERVREKYKAQAAKCPAKFLYQALRYCNECDIHYRESSNKRLLVELTLIEIAQETQADHAHAHDTAAGESNREGLVHAGLHCGICRAHIGLGSNLHPKETGENRTAGTQQKADAGSPADEEPNQEEKNRNKNSKNLVLGHQEGIGALRNSRGDFLHTRGSGRGFGNIVCLISGKAQRTDGQDGDQPE
jgi:ABC-type Fe3+/spermidine/putrescine transport system ATPase subunit